MLATCISTVAFALNFYKGYYLCDTSAIWAAFGMNISILYSSTNDFLKVNKIEHHRYLSILITQILVMGMIRENSNTIH